MRPKPPRRRINNLGWAKLNRRNGPSTLAKRTVLRQTRSGHARTEIFAIRRAVYESAARAGAFAPYDPIPFVALHAHERGFFVDGRHLGTFYESDANRDAIRAREQVIRFAFQAASAYVRRQHATGMADAGAQSEIWKQIVIAGIEKAFNAMAVILREIAGSSKAPVQPPLPPVPVLDDAILLSAQAHRGQLDRAGEPYILHVLRVALKQTDPESRVVAMLHDIVEDTGVSLADLRRHGYGDEVVKAVDCLTRREGESYDEYLGRVLTNPIACRVKRADLRDNMDPSRLSSSHKDSSRREQYTRALSRLTNARPVASPGGPDSEEETGILDEAFSVRQIAQLTEFDPWLTDERVRQNAELCAGKTMLLHHAHSAAGAETSVGDSWEKVRKLAEFAEEDPEKLILGLLPYCYDPSVLIKSKNLLSKPWDAHTFSDAKSYKPEYDGEMRGISLVLFYDLQPDVRAKLDQYFAPAGAAYLSTARHHFTIASVQERMPKAAVDDVCEQFVEAWNVALVEQKGFRGVTAKLLRNPRICSDELRLLQEAVLLFGSSEGGFLNAVHELRLRTMRSVLRSVAPLVSGRRQPLWAHSVLGRKVADLNAKVFDRLPTWPLPGVESRMTVRNPYLALMVFRDRKALLAPEREVRLQVE